MTKGAVAIHDAQHTVRGWLPVTLPVGSPPVTAHVPPDAAPVSTLK
jgi:hypothetical protein